MDALRAVTLSMGGGGCARMRCICVASVCSA